LHLHISASLNSAFGRVSVDRFSLKVIRMIASVRS
jgi:hypothetical protein